jgi:hypothetical protein
MGGGGIVAVGGTGTVHYDACLGVQAVIQAIGLTGIPGAQVIVQELPIDRGLTLPCVIVSPGPMAETIGRGTNIEEDYGYPCLVTIVAARNQDATLQEKELKWRQQIRNAFRAKNVRPAALIAALTVPLIQAVWAPAPILDLDLFKNDNLLVSAAVIWVKTRESRS